LVKGDYIPVEYKSGRVPRGPLFSHIIQVTAYCILVEEKYGKTPPYGIIKYGKKDFQIEYTDDLKELVLKKVAEIKRAEITGIAHRNHNNPGRCLGCSRREFCDEKLA
ncbi:MAG: Dna2/Cas4 domain-containing protein, partial [Thermoplasmata archaeon]